MDERAIIITDKYIYKLDPKKSFYSKKANIPLDDVCGVSVTSGKEQLVVIHLTSKQDLVFYMQTKIDRVGELVGHIAQLKRKSYVAENKEKFSVDVQRYISANISKHKYVINIIWHSADKVEFSKASNNNITLTLPDAK